MKFNMKLPHPLRSVPYDPLGFPRRSNPHLGKSSSARGYCTNHPEFKAIVMQKHGSAYQAFCACCVARAEALHAKIHAK
jgi:hypothetical protein